MGPSTLNGVGGCRGELSGRSLFTPEEGKGNQEKKKILLGHVSRQGFHGG